MEQQGCIILDGALATELEHRGADLNDDLWSAKILLEQPALIYQVHLDYLKAGADIITTASYQATFEGLAKRGYTNQQAIQIFQLSLQLAQRAVDDFWSQSENQVGRIKPLVAASIGPYGAMLADGSEYHGNYKLTKEELMNFHRPRIQTLVDLGAKLLAFETIPSQLEAVALTTLLAEFPNIFAWLSFSCGDKLHVCHGELLSDCVKLANNKDQIIAVGINCTPPTYMESLIKAAKSATTKPIIIYPNSGEKWDAANHCWLENEESLSLSAYTNNWRQKGAQLIGGCCRTKPADIAKIRKGCLRR